MWENRLKTVILLATLSGLLMFFGGALGGYKGIQVALFMSLFMNIIAYFFSSTIVLKMYRAQPLDKEQYSSLYNMVQELAHTLNIPMPKLYIIHTPMANAFATGRNPSNAAVAVTTGILNLLDQHELRGVLAHELSHVKNRDILVSTVAATLATAIGYLANMVQYMAFLPIGSSDDRRRSANPIVLLVVAIIMPIAAALIQLAISRSREYMADESGAEASHDPLALASALEKLHTSIKYAHLNNNDTARASTAHLFIVHPFSVSNWTALFSTHPPMEKRIARLKKIYERMFLA